MMLIFNLLKRVFKRARLQIFKGERLPLFLSLLAMLFALWLEVDPPSSLNNFITRLDNVVYDQRYSLFLPSRGEGDHKIVVVDFDQRSL